MQLLQMQMPAAARGGVFVLAEGAAPPGGRCLAQSLSAPTADSLRSKLTRAAICRSWPSAPDREGEQLQRGKYNRDAKKQTNKKTNNSSTLAVRPAGCADVRGAVVEPRLWIHARRASLAVPGGGIFLEDKVIITE